MLRCFDLHDGNLNNRQVGVFTYDTDKKEFTMTVDSNIPLADLPLSLEIRVQKGNFTIEHDEVLTWIRGRICPPGRHNIKEILHDNGLKKYDEFDILMVTMARSDKDELYLVERTTR